MSEISFSGIKKGNDTPQINALDVEKRINSLRMESSAVQDGPEADAQFMQRNDDYAAKLTRAISIEKMEDARRADVEPSHPNEGPLPDVRQANVEPSPPNEEHLLPLSDIPFTGSHRSRNGISGGESGLERNLDTPQTRGTQLEQARLRMEALFPGGFFSRQGPGKIE